jgi:phytoene dehydrogenase-like protein
VSTSAKPSLPSEARSYLQHAPQGAWDAIVIGSGIGGLGAAALLARHARKRVLVLERHYTPGGFTHVFRRPGYEWDVGLHYIGKVLDARSPVRRLFDHVTGGRLAWAPMPEDYDHLLVGDRRYEFVAGLERFRERLAEYFPQRRREIDAYLKAVQGATAGSGRYFAAKAMPALLARLVGRFLRAPFLRYSDRTTAAVVGSLTSDLELAAVLTAQWGDYGLPPAESSFAVHAMIAEHYFDGAAYPVGGAGRIAEDIAPVIQESGGEVLVKAEVKDILLEGSRAAGVRMTDGRELRASIVISDTGAHNTFARLLPPEVSGKLGVLEKLRRIPPSFGHLCLYVGLKKTAAALGLPKSNLWIFPGNDHDANVKRFLEDPAAPLPVVFISFPSAKDPSFEERCPGRATIEVITLAPYAWFSRWEQTAWKRRGPDYDDWKRWLSARLRESLETHVPQVRGQIDFQELSTPLSTRHFANYESGEAYGLAAVPERFRCEWLRPATPVPGLYLTGQDVTTMGVTGALFGAALCVSAILRRNLLARI